MRFVNNEKGMTLIEILVAITISGIVGIFLARIFEVNSQVMTGEQKVMTMNSNARQGIYELAKNIRLLGYDPMIVGSSTFGITAADGTSINFTADINNNAVLDANESFGYLLVSGTAACPSTCIASIVPGGGGAARIVAEDITASPAPAVNPAFCLQYTFTNGSQSDAKCANVINLPDNTSSTLNFDNIRKVTITITTRTEDVHNLSKQFNYETVTTTVMLRNNLPV
ncbi:MAG: type II secretion system protein J [Nitrospinota bacterium]